MVTQVLSGQGQWTWPASRGGIGAGSVAGTGVGAGTGAGSGAGAGIGVGAAMVVSDGLVVTFDPFCLCNRMELAPSTVCNNKYLFP